MRAIIRFIIKIYNVIENVMFSVLLAFVSLWAVTKFLELLSECEYLPVKLRQELSVVPGFIVILVLRISEYLGITNIDENWKDLAQEEQSFVIGASLSILLAAISLAYYCILRKYRPIDRKVFGI